jgi:uncharacterized repeat protein (TIGR01451 family)
MKNFLNKIVNFAKNHPVVLGALAAAVVIPVAVNAWGPNRDTFTIEKPATRVVFNSITNNPDIGDERNFVRIRNLNDKTAKWSDDIKITESGEYVVRMYVHNNAADNLNLVAENTAARFNVPTYSAKQIQIDGFLSSSNAQPGTVYDQAIFTSDKNFKLNYVAGSAKYTNNVFTGGVKLNDSIVNGNGTLLGYDKLDGKIPGCFKYSGWVTFTVKAEVEKTGDFTVEKTVRKNGDKTWTKSVNAKTGDKVDYQIEFKNTGETQLNNVVIADQLPAGVEIVPGSVYLKNASNPNVLNITDSLVHGGANIGHYTAGSNALLKFTAVVKDNTCGTKTLVNTASATTSVGKKNSTANVVVSKYCEAPKPAYQCSALAVNLISSKNIVDAKGNTGKSATYEFNTTYKVENTTFQGVRYIVKNAKGEVVANQVVNGGTKMTFTANIYAKETYTVTATIITAAGENTNANCAKSFTVEAPVKALKCDLITITKISRTKFEISTSYTQQNISSVVVKYEIKDKNGKVVKTFENNGSKVQVEITQSGTYTVIAQLNGEGKTANCEKTFTVEEAPKVKTPEVKIVKTVNGKKDLTVEAGKDFTYELVVRNTGEVDLKDVTVTDKAPANVKFISADKGTITNQTLKYTIPTLKIGASETIKITAQATATSMKAKNVACVDTPTVPGDNDGCDSANIEVPKKENPPVPSNPVPPTTSEVELPKELPQTGIADGFGAILAIGSLTAAASAYLASRRMI